MHWKLSDSLGAQALRDAVLEAIYSKLPKGMKRLVDAVRFFRVQEHS